MHADAVLRCDDPAAVELRSISSCTQIGRSICFFPMGSGQRLAEAKHPIAPNVFDHGGEQSQFI
ncbi:hypothetical protein E2562_030499, partial [Oryza meyeriana var. granulata]